jgi:hypothetical protein
MLTAIKSPTTGAANIMKNWYKNINKWQKVFIFLASTALILAFGIGLLPLAALIYLELGERFDNSKTQQ